MDRNPKYTKNRTQHFKKKKFSKIQKKQHNKSQLFLFDMIFSFTIFILVIGFYYFYYVDTIDNNYIYDLNVNILNGFTNTKINTLNDEFIRKLFIEGKIYNIENTVAEQVISFYVDGETEYAKNLTKIFVKDYIQKNMNFILSIEELNGSNYVELYRFPEPPYHFTVNLSDASVATVKDRVIFLFKNESTFYGPYKFKVVMWK